MRTTRKITSYPGDNYFRYDDTPKMEDTNEETFALYFLHNVGTSTMIGIQQLQSSQQKNNA